MSYTIDESLNDSEYTAAGNVAGVFGTPRHLESITIHHWGSFGQTHDGVVDFFVNRNRNTSAHFVVSDGRIHCLVSPADAAWAAGNAYGNATSIHIECHPEATDGDYATVAWLVARLREWYGNLPLRPHNSWTPTSCPGIWDLSRIDALAAGSSVPEAPAAPAPEPQQPVAAPPAAAGDPKRLHWVVEPGDTLAGIADYYGVPERVGEIAAYNGITDPDTIWPNQCIYIPGRLVWTVDPGDTLGGIAAHYGLTAETVAANNGIAPDLIYPGQVIVIQP